MTVDKLQILRTLDKADRMEPFDIFKLLTEGRLDNSGAFTEGCGLDNSQAIVLTGFVFSASRPIIYNRLHLMRLLEEKVIDETSGKTAWDYLLDLYVNLPEPKNIAWILDDIVIEIQNRQHETSSK